MAALAYGRSGGITLMEFGLRRAQGPDGGVSASKYSYIGGFDGTSNVLAGLLYGMKISGTHAHAFVTSFRGFEDIPNDDSCKLLSLHSGEKEDFVSTVKKYREKVKDATHTNTSELAAFTAYAIAFPKNFLALVDTYNTLKSGVINFLVVALALNHFGYSPIGVRLDSGDLAYLSVKTRMLFKEVANSFPDVKSFESLKICASSDIDEELLHSLNRQGHEIDIFGIGTNLVTCKSNPALGCVYKLVEIDGSPRIKLSNDVTKVTLPGRKDAYRLYGKDGPLLDIMLEAGSKPPNVGESIYCRNPFDETKRCFVKPSDVVPLHHLVWDGKIVGEFRKLDEIRAYSIESLESLRPDHKYTTNPTPYKVSLSGDLYNLFHKLWLQEAPIEELN
eukprot:TRINITY_DN865_c1_g2_i6.p1 TRINITY_DN865_c1_g2~~TRINITY_DN865_c1_g2_i6.p1  ORF type:complete len:390 (-),score=91.93 TRINITY_DN865_c1_g2_i6:51-1220(-)